MGSGLCAAKTEPGATFARWFEAGKVPAGDATMFFTNIMTFAEGQRDSALFEKVLSASKAARGHEERLRPFYATSDARLARLVRYHDLAAKAAAGDAQGEFDFVLMRIEWGELDVGQAKAAIAATKVGAQEKAAAAPWLLGYEVKELAAAARTSEQRTELQQKLADMFRAGSVPKSATHLFFINVLMHAESTKDTTLLDKAMVAAKEACAAEPMLMATVSRFESLAKQAK